MRFLRALAAASLVSQAVCAPQQKILGIETAPAAAARFPSLIDATIDDLNEGLGSGLFTSVDLVQVRTTMDGWYSELQERLLSRAGIFGTHT